MGWARTTLGKKSPASERDRAGAAWIAVAHAVQVDTGLAAAWSYLQHPQAVWSALLLLHMGLPDGIVGASAVQSTNRHTAADLLPLLHRVRAASYVSSALDSVAVMGVCNFFTHIGPAEFASRQTITGAQRLVEASRQILSLEASGRPIAECAAQHVGVEIEFRHQGYDVYSQSKNPYPSRSDACHAVAAAFTAIGLEGSVATHAGTLKLPDKPTYFPLEQYTFRRGAKAVHFEVLRGTAATMIFETHLDEDGRPGEAEVHRVPMGSSEDPLGKARGVMAKLVMNYLEVSDVHAEQMRALVQRRDGTARDTQLGVLRCLNHVMMIKDRRGDLHHVQVGFLPDGEAILQGITGRFCTPDGTYKVVASSLPEVFAAFVESVKNNPDVFVPGCTAAGVQSSLGAWSLINEQLPFFEAVSPKIAFGDLWSVAVAVEALREAGYLGTAPFATVGVHVHAEVRSMAEAVMVLRTYADNEEAIQLAFAPSTTRQPFMQPLDPTYKTAVLSDAYPIGSADPWMQLAMLAHATKSHIPKYVALNMDPAISSLVFQFADTVTPGTTKTVDLLHHRVTLTAKPEGVEAVFDNGTPFMVNRLARKDVELSAGWKSTAEGRLFNTYQAPNQSGEMGLHPESTWFSASFWGSLVATARQQANAV